VYPDPKYWWVLPKNYLKLFVFSGSLREHENESFRVNLRENGNFSLNFSRKRNFFAKSFAKTEAFRENHPGNKIFCERFRKNVYFRETKFRDIPRKASEFSLFFAFRENEKKTVSFQPYCSVVGMSVIQIGHGQRKGFIIGYRYPSRNNLIVQKDPHSIFLGLVFKSDIR
jgi:hypothetical protein